MAPFSFAERFGYARWLKHLVDGDAPGWAAIGRVVERTGQAVSGWASAAEAPTDYRVHEPLADFLGVEKEWLVKGAGQAPRPELWSVWTHERRAGRPMTPARPSAGGRSALLDRLAVEPEEIAKPYERKAPAKKASAKKAGGGKAG